MIKIGIIGLGLIGGSLAKAAKAHTDFCIYGFNRTKSVTESALSDKSIDLELTKENASECDMLIVSLMPDVTVNIINDFAPFLKKGCIVVDCTGVKECIVNALSKKLNESGICFIGGHPMAGKEVAGYENADAELFKNASMILCRDEYTDDEAFSRAEGIFRAIGFPRIKETTAKEHDRVIAYTSQLAHIVSSAYVKSDTLSERYGFSAGSFKDLTRVAKLNENMWTDLFLANKDALLDEVNSFISNMENYREALLNEDADELRHLLGEGRMLKEHDEECEKEAYEHQDIKGKI